MQSPFLTLSEVTVYLRRDGDDRELTPRKLANCREWLRRRGVYPVAGRFRLAAIDLAVTQEEFKALRKRQRGRAKDGQFGSLSRRHASMKTPNAEAGHLHSLEGGE